MNSFFRSALDLAYTVCRSSSMARTNPLVVIRQDNLWLATVYTGVTGNDNERLFGLDFQFTAGRFGLRGEAMAGNMPSTLPNLQPEFFPAFRPGVHSSAAELLVSYSVAGSNNLYARYN